MTAAELKKLRAICERRGAEFRAIEADTAIVDLIDEIEQFRAALLEACDAFVAVETLYIAAVVDFANRHPNETTTMSGQIVPLQDRVSALAKLVQP